MSEIVVIGGGIVSLTTAMLLARDGHSVTVLERDAAAPPADSAAAWHGWERRSVAQFRQVHYFAPRFPAIVERELPDALAHVEDAGALRYNPLDTMPVQLRGADRPGDERFVTLTGRRPVMERAFAVAADATPGVRVRRGVVVRGLVAGDATKVGAAPRVVGVDTDSGVVRADLVIDASGRRSALPTWLAALGATPAAEQTEDSGFAYYTRHFRSADGSVPAPFGPPLQPYGSISLLTLAADNGTWGVGIIASAKDKAMRRTLSVPVWDAVVRNFPLVAHWLDAEPLTGVYSMSNLPDRIRTILVDGEPVVTGLLPVGDAWACTNPSVGRGITLGAMHALALRGAVREVGVDDGGALASAFAEHTGREVEPWFHDTLAFDRHRLAEMEAHANGVPYTTDDPAWHLGPTLASSATRDADLLRAYLEIVTVTCRGPEVLAPDGIAQRALDLATYDGLPGPDRAALEALVHSHPG